jgi:hypothetical protein
MYYVITSSLAHARARPHRGTRGQCPVQFILSLAMDLEELETLLRKPAHTEEDCERIVGSCNSFSFGYN